jgi:hypothetical protein
LAHRHKKTRKSSETDEEIEDNLEEPEIEVIEDEGTIAGEPSEIQDSDEVSGHHI